MFDALRKLLTAITPAIGPLLSPQVSFLAAAPEQSRSEKKKKSRQLDSSAHATDSTLTQSVASPALSQSEASARVRSKDRHQDTSVDNARAPSASKHISDKEKRAKEQRALARLLDPVKAYTLIHEGVTFALADSSGKRVKLRTSSYKELSPETRQAFLDL